MVKVNLAFLASPPQGLTILNVGTGVPRSFRELADLVVAAAGGLPPVEVPFPGDLRDHYQPFTRADTAAPRAAGYTAPMMSPEDGIVAYRRSFAEDAFPPAVRRRAA